MIPRIFPNRSEGVLDIYSVYRPRREWKSFMPHFRLEFAENAIPLIPGSLKDLQMLFSPHLKRHFSLHCTLQTYASAPKVEPATGRLYVLMTGSLTRLRTTLKTTLSSFVVEILDARENLKAARTGWRRSEWHRFPFWLGSRFSIIYRSDGQRRLLRLNAEFLGFNHLSDPPQDRGQQFI
jgi:hypothetical protein